MSTKYSFLKSSTKLCNIIAGFTLLAFILLAFVNAFAISNYGYDEVGIVLAIILTLFVGIIFYIFIKAWGELMLLLIDIENHARNISEKIDIESYNKSSESNSADDISLKT